jgi:hypothetical protein
MVLEVARRDDEDVTGVRGPPLRGDEGERRLVPEDDVRMAAASSVAPRGKRAERAVVTGRRVRRTGSAR